MIKFLFSFLFLFNIAICSAQVSDKIEKLLTENEKYIGYRSMHPKARELEELIDKEATADELCYLSLNGSVSRRVLAIKALVKRGDEKIVDVFKQALLKDGLYEDEKELYVWGTYSFPVLIYCEVFPYTLSDSPSGKFYRQTLEVMFELIIEHRADDVKLLESLAYWLPLKEKYYDFVREKVVKSKSSKLLVHVAKYQKQQDVDLILSFGKDAFAVIEEFPHDAFLPILETNFQESGSYPFMFALGKYCNEKAYGIAEKVIEYNVSKLDAECGNFCLDALYNQLEKDGCKLFYPLLEELWKTQKIISFNVYNNYKLTHSNDETANFLLNGFLLDAEPIINKDNTFDIEALLDVEGWATKEDNLTLLLIELKHLTKEKYAKALKHNLKHIWGGGLEDFLVSLDDAEVLNYISNTLKDRFNSPEDITDMLYITDVARKFKDEELYQYCLKNIRKKRNDFKKNDYFEEEYQDFLKRHKIK